MGIKFTDDQKEIVDFLMEQIDNPNGHNVIVSGSGGTGKTTMLCELISQLIENGYRVAVTAMTGKATAVLRNKIYENIRNKCIEVLPGTLLIETVAKLTKESKVLGLTDSGETVYTNTWRDPRNFADKYDILFVDELSMVPHFISQWWMMSGIRVFGFGDECQLPEVCTNETKKEISGFKHDLKVPEMQYVSGYGVKVLKELAQKQLHKVLRSDNEIALLCGELRDFTQSKSQMLGRIKSWAEKSQDIFYSTSMSDLQTNAEWQIICYTNKMCQKINAQLCIGTEYPDLSDKIILCDNLNPLGAYNGDTMIFQDLLSRIDKYNRNSKFPIYVCLKWQGKMPSKYGNSIEKKFFNNYVAFKQTIKTTNILRLQLLPEIMRGSGYAPNQVENWISDIETFKTQYPDPGECFIQLMEEFQKVNLDMAQYIMDNVPPMPRLYMVTADFGYAITTHKSQGSEYPKVCYIMERFDKPLIYTGLSRAKQQLMVINRMKE